MGDGKFFVLGEGDSCSETVEIQRTMYYDGIRNATQKKKDGNYHEKNG